MKALWTHALLLGALLAASPAAAAGNPDFDAVTWTAFSCDASPLVSHASPSSIDLQGDATFAPMYFAHDGTYAYFRYRVDGNPSGPGGFAQYSWTALMQVPSGDAFQYQYQLSLNGDGDNIEIWQNTVASDISFSPLFHDSSETKLFSQNYTFSNPSTVNTTPLARSLPTGDGSNFGNNPDYFVDFAFPLSALVSSGALANAADIDRVLFFPATSTNPNNYNKAYLNCPFLPVAAVTIDKSVSPTAAPVNTTTPIVYTIVVQNTGPGFAKGIEIEDPALPSFMSNVAVTVSASDPMVGWTIVSDNPLEVKVPELPAGATVTVQIAADAKPGCATGDFTNVAHIDAVNAMFASGNALLHVSTGAEVCDGVDNDCNGQVDEGTGLCNDGNPCTTDTCSAGACAHSTPDPSCTCSSDAQCDDGNGCTTDACTAGTCTHVTPDPTCVPCTTAAQCDDGNGCTTDSCSAGACTHVTPDPTCVPCTTAHDCVDANGCTMDMCNAFGVCEHPAQAGCTPCASVADCDDHDGCTVDECGADGSCMMSFTPGCQRCTTVSDCNDHDVCTLDRCTGGSCAHDPSSGCTQAPEICDDGTDNDGDGLVDCDDPDCASSSACKPREICGNCIDDNGDGLVDYEDPECCNVEVPMDIRRLTLKPGASARGNRIKLKSRFASGAPMMFDPTKQDASIQIADADGDVFCATIGGAHWQHPGRAIYRFNDKSGAFAGGLRKGRFKVKRSGKMIFTTRGKKMTVPSMSAKDVRVTLRVGGLCAKDTKTLRTTKKALRFP